jgi:hypothetical protein
MLSRGMALTEQWDEIEDGLAGDWSDARLRLTLADDAAAARANALLGSVAPWRTGHEIRFFVVRRGVGVRPGSLRRALSRLDDEQIGGTLELVGSSAAAAAAPEVPRATLAESWDALLETLPPDWSDLYLELELYSSDWIARASLNMTPLSARRKNGTPTLLFRAARTFGYGAAPEMVRRCLERCDRDSMRGELRMLRVLSDTIPVGTQGPVWQIDGRTV